MGRNMFGPVRGRWPDESWTGWWGDDPPYHAPVFVLTNHPRRSITMDGGTTFHFVTDRIHDTATGDIFEEVTGVESTGTAKCCPCMTHTYIRRIPSPPLDAFVDYLYYLAGPLPHPHTSILPTPWLDLKINFGGALNVCEMGRDEPSARFTESWCVGIWSGCHIVHWPPDLKLFGVRFKPEGAYPFLRLSLSELRNRVVPLDVIWGRFAADIREQLRGAPTILAGFDQLEQALLAHLGEVPHGFKVVRFGVAEIARQHGALSMRALSEHIGISQKHLLTQFKRMVGISPKVMACLSRLQYALRSIDLTQPVDWALVAMQCGYYDQAHLSNDFMTHLGHSPTDYLRLRHRAQAENQERDQVPRTLPVG